MAAQIRPERYMNSYKVLQLDVDGRVLSETHVEGPSYNGVIRDLNAVVEGTQRIEVYNDEGEKAGTMGVDYWRRKVRRT